MSVGLYNIIKSWQCRLLRIDPLHVNITYKNYLEKATLNRCVFRSFLKSPLFRLRSHRILLCGSLASRYSFDGESLFQQMSDSEDGSMFSDAESQHSSAGSDVSTENILLCINSETRPVII